MLRNRQENTKNFCFRKKKSLSWPFLGEKNEKAVNNLFKKYAEPLIKILTFRTKKSMMYLPIFEEVNHS